MERWTLNVDDDDDDDDDGDEDGINCEIIEILMLNNGIIYNIGNV